MAGKGQEPGPELVTLEAVRKLVNQSIAQHKAEQNKLLEKQLAQQKAYYEDLMQKQADIFTKLVRALMDSNNERLDTANNNLHELKNSLQFSQHEIDISKNNISKLTEDSERLEKNLRVVCDSIKILDRSTDYLENQSRRNNLIFSGIEESPKETWASSENKVRSVISTSLKLDANAMAIERAHRTGKPDTNGKGHRPIIVKFLNYKDRATVLENAKKLKGTDIHINEDFSAQVRERRKALLPEMYAARDRGLIAYLKYDQLVTHPPRRKGQPVYNPTSPVSLAAATAPATSTPK